MASVRILGRPTWLRRYRADRRVRALLAGLSRAASTAARPAAADLEADEHAVGIWWPEVNWCG